MTSIHVSFLLAMVCSHGTISRDYIYYNLDCYTRSISRNPFNELDILIFKQITKTAKELFQTMDIIHTTAADCKNKIILPSWQCRLYYASSFARWSQCVSSLITKRVVDTVSVFCAALLLPLGYILLNVAYV